MCESPNLFNICGTIPGFAPALGVASLHQNLEIMPNTKIVGAPYIFAETLYRVDGAATAAAMSSVRTFRYHGCNETGKNQVKRTQLR